MGRKKKAVSAVEKLYAADEASEKYIKKRDKRSKERAKERKRKRHKFKFGLLEWSVTILLAAAIACLINTFVIVNSVVPSGSMEPTIMTDSRMIGLRVSYLLSGPERGDVIIFRYPDDETKIFVKRVIGLPGETVTITDGTVYIDGEPLEEDYLTVTTLGDFGPYEVPEECYFVLGDNRNNSLDSRYWDNTYVPEENILAKALLCYWPVSEIKLIE